MSDLSIVKCTQRSSNSQIGVSNCDPKPSGYLFTFSFFCLRVGGGARDIEADLRLAVNFFGGCHLFMSLVVALFSIWELDEMAEVI